MIQGIAGWRNLSITQLPLAKRLRGWIKIFASLKKSARTLQPCIMSLLQALGFHEQIGAEREFARLRDRNLRERKPREQPAQWDIKRCPIFNYALQFVV
jgi:hypothetical protein